MATYGTLLQPGDLVTDKAVVAGTVYFKNQIVVTSVSSEDLISVGVIHEVIIRMDRLIFVIALYDAIRTSFRFFQACPREKVDIVDYNHLSDFKPLYRRDNSKCFRFFLHHHLPTPLS